MKYLLLLLPFNLWANCPAPELVPAPVSLQQLSCGDCACVVQAHAESIKALQPERSKFIKKNLAPKLQVRVSSLLSSLVDSDRILKISGAQESLNAKTLDSCNLERISSEAQCPGANNSAHIKSIFGVNSLNEVVTKLKSEFQGGQETKGLSCFSAEEAGLIDVTATVVKSFGSFLTEIHRNKDQILQELGSQSLFKILSSGKFPGLEERFGSLVKNPLLKAMLYDNQIVSELVSKSDQFTANTNLLARFIMFESGKRINPDVLNQSLQDSCDQLISTVKTSICAEDRLAQSFYPDPDKVSPVLNDLTGFDPTMHDPAYDADMAALMDPEGASIVESSYAGHLFWCSAKECAAKDGTDPCHGASLSRQENKIFSDFMAYYLEDEQFLNLKNDQKKSNEQLCALADCRNLTQSKQNSCVEKVQDQMGDQAGASVAALNFLTSLNNQEPGAGDHYVPYSKLLEQLKNPSPLAKAILGEKPSPTVASDLGDDVNNSSSTDDPKTANKNEKQNNHSVNPVKTKTAVTNTGGEYPSKSNHGASSFFADRAFQDFMNRIPKPEISNKTSQVSPADRRALESLNQASETIEKMREEYRRDAFEQMEEMFKHASTRQQQNVAGANASVGVGINQNNSTAPYQNNQVPANGNIAAGQHNIVAGDHRNVASTGSGVAAGADKPPRVFMQAGQPTLSVGLDELPAISESSLQQEGLDPGKPFQLAVKVNQKVYLVAVRPSVIEGKRMLAPMLDQLSPSLRSEVLKSPLFAEYRHYLMQEFTKQ